MNYQFKLDDLVLFDRHDLVYKITKIEDEDRDIHGFFYRNFELTNAFRIGILGIERKLKKYTRKAYMYLDKNNKCDDIPIQLFDFETLNNFVSNLVKIPVKRSKYGSTWNLDHLTTEDLEIELDKRLTTKKD